MLAELDQRIIRRGYASRSEFVRDLIRDLLTEEGWSKDKLEVYGVLTIVYDHHQRDLVARIMDVQHRRHLNILCTTHIHLDRRQCLETIIIRGTPQTIEDAATEIGGLRGVNYHGLTRAMPSGSRAKDRRKAQSRRNAV
jgi:CopG family nickel-responsive transcriptional regulator